MALTARPAPVWIVTSGRLGFFPPGFLVGRVDSVGEHAESLHLSIAVRPELTSPPEGRVWILKPGPRTVNHGDTSLQDRALQRRAMQGGLGAREAGERF